MNTTTTAPIRTADLADELAAGMSFPMRDALLPASVAAVAVIKARRAFWLAAAAGYSAQVKAGCVDAAHDAREAFAQAARYAA